MTATGGSTASADHGPRIFDPEVAAGAGFPTITYETLEVGTELRSDDRLIRPQDIETYAFAVDDDDPLFFEPGPFGPPVAHPTLLANQALFLRHNRYVVPAGLHAGMVFEFLAPIPLGTRARTTGEVIDKYVRRDKPYMVTAYETADESGAPLVRGRFVQMLFARDTAPPSGTAPKPEPPAPHFDPTIPGAVGRSEEPIRAGQELTPAERSITQRQIDAYSGVKPRSIHTDPAWAAAKGFPTTIAQGMMSTAYVSAVMTAALGAGFVVGGRIDVRFLRPVFEGDTLTTTARITGFSRDGTADGGGAGHADDGVRVHAQVETRNQDGGVTLAGTASGLAPAAPARR